MTESDRRDELSSGSYALFVGLTRHIDATLLLGRTLERGPNLVLVGHDDHVVVDVVDHCVHGVDEVAAANRVENASVVALHLTRGRDVGEPTAVRGGAQLVVRAGVKRCEQAVLRGVKDEPVKAAVERRRI